MLYTLSRNAVQLLFKLPTPAQVLVSGGKKRKINGRVVDPNYQFLGGVADRVPGFEDMTLERARWLLSSMSSTMSPDKEEVQQVENLTINNGDTRIRIYTPDGVEDNAPAIVYYHGGGWILGGIRDYDTLCRSIANRAKCRVFSVGYRRSPEHRYPAAADDAISAFNWVVDHAQQYGLDKNRIGVAGDSAGGNLAAVTSVMAQQNNTVMPAFQVLMYPMVSLVHKTKSLDTYAKGFGVAKSTIEWFIESYVDEADRGDIKASPLLQKSHAGQPKTLMIAAGFDPLIDEGVMYKEKLERDGVDVDYVMYDDMVHSFVTLNGISPSAEKAVEDMLSRIKQLVHQSGVVQTQKVAGSVA